jgi:hypothetical protein
MTSRLLALSALSLIALSACAPEDSDALALDESVEASALKGGAKVDVCHITGSGGINILSVSSSALTAHLAHGDHAAGTYYLDSDGDGEGDAGTTAECLFTSYVENGDDCDDADASINTSAEEICDDGIDNNCDGQVDEECSVELTITVAGDNGVWGWIDGTPLVFDDPSANWQLERVATVEVDSGMDHAVAFYVEDWGGLGYIASSIRVDGVVEVVTGYGDFMGTYDVVSYVNEYPRIADWANTPSSSTDSLNMLSGPGTTWGDWMQVGFDDSSWTADSQQCTNNNWNTTAQHGFRGTFTNLYADGGEFVWFDMYGYPGYPGLCNSARGGDTAAFFRTELSL